MQIIIDDFLVSIETKRDGKKEYFYFEYFGLIDGKKYDIICEKLFDAIDFIELLKAFLGNKLNTKKSYKIANLTAQIKQKNKENYLYIYFNFKEELYLDKYECSKLAAKLSKILNKVEIFG